MCLIIVKADRIDALNSILIYFKDPFVLRILKAYLFPY